jgi:membrane-associated phospholipid phosphatase
MSRGIGESAVVGGLPEWAGVVGTLVTTLGGVGFLFAALGVLYWFGDALPGPVSLSRRRGGFAVALGVGALAATTTAKAYFGLPRPPAADDPAGIGVVPSLLHPVYVPAATADGFGFPSGHATAAVVVFGGLALLVGTRRSYALGGLTAVAVSLSRVVIEVHYLVDVFAGWLLGGTYLAGVYLLCDRGDNASRALFVALGVALAGVGTGGYTFDTMAVLGATLAARITWGSVGDAIVYESATRVGGAVATVVGLSFAALFAAVETLEPAPYVAFLGVAVVFGGVLSAPLVGEAAARRL